MENLNILRTEGARLPRKPNLSGKRTEPSIPSAEAVCPPGEGFGLSFLQSRWAFGPAGSFHFKS